MRKFLVAASIAAVLAAAGALAWKAEAAVSGGTAIPTAAKNFTPIEKAACGRVGAHCGPYRHWVCGPAGRHCWCAPC